MWQSYLADNKGRFLDELLDFLRIPSISSLPDHAEDVKQAGEWVMARMEAAGIENIQMMPTGGHPVVYGDWLHAEGQPTIMIYGHFDVQPVDPLELWHSGPFEPVVNEEEGRIYARGATDDKGNMLTPILATEALLNSEGRLPVNVKYFFEGQEEIGSPQLGSFIAANRELLRCDMVISSDGGQWEEDQPALLIGLKGLCALQIDVKGAKGDLHSGMHGGAIQNPIHALARLLDSMRGHDGKILIDGFYDDVRPLSEQDRAHIAAVPFEEEQYKAQLEVNEVFGEPGYGTLERRWARPTLEVNGIWGGFQGDGVKTVLPNLAHAKITCRLVADQDPHRILELIEAHIEKHTPPGVTIDVTPGASTAQAYLMPTDHPGNDAARRVHQKLYGKDPFYVRTGGSIPFCGLIKELLDVYTVNFAFGLSDEQAHAPNEFFRLKNFDRGQRGYCMLLHELATK